MEVSRRHLEMDALLHKSLNCLNAALSPTESLLVAFDNEEVLAYAGNGRGVLGESGIAKELCFLLVACDELFYFEDIAPADTSITKKLNDMEISVAISLVHEHRCVGALVFGCKQNGQSYTAKDIELLRLSAHTLSLAIQNSVQYETIKRTAENLQTEVALATKQISHKNKKLRQLIQSKDEFVSMASHQLLPQITSIEGLIEIVRSNPEQTAEVLQLVRHSASRMSSLVVDMLNLSKVQNGQLEISLKEVDLVKLVQKEITGCSISLKKAGLIVKYTHPVEAKVTIDPAKFREAVFNILDNAIVYSNKNGTIKVSIFKMPKAVRLEIADEGIGIPRQEQSQLFKNYFRASNARKKRPSGTGIGLFVAKKIFDAHNSTFTLCSSEGGGTKAIIDLDT